MTTTQSAVGGLFIFVGCALGYCSATLRNTGLNQEIQTVTTQLSNIGLMISIIVIVSGFLVIYFDQRGVSVYGNV